VSIINRMLQDLDRRQALDPGDAKAVRAAPAKPPRREWFWRALVVLLTAALAWMGWVAIQLLPRKPLVTDLAYRAATEARARNEAKPAPAPAPAAPVPESAPVAAVPPSTPSNEPLRLETELKTPPAQREPAPVAALPEKPKAAAPVTKRAREQQAKASNADLHFRRAMVLLKDARVGEAEDEFLTALQIDPRHTAARQAYVSLLLDQQRVSTARGLLQDTLAADPAQAWFALALARIHAMGRDYGGALAVLDRAASVGKNAEFLAYRGTMLQRLGRHEEALEAFQSAVRDGAAPATAWIGYGMSLEALGKRSDAAHAYRRALTSGPIAAEARDYAESRARALE
jgi:MSHA biogenesis protein MshN